MRKVLYIFGQLNDSDVVWLGEVGHLIQLGAGSSLIQSGVPLVEVYVVLDGELTVVGSGGATLAVLGAGEILGEMSFVDSRPPSATVLATKDSRLLAIPSTIMRERMQSDVAFAARFYRAVALFLASRMRATMTRFGYGAVTAQDDQDGVADEIDSSVLDAVHLAGGRFERLQRQLSERISRRV